MARWWRGGLAALGVFALFWLFSVWQWQTQATDVQARDLWLHLLLAPVLVCLAGAVAWLLLRRVRDGGGAGGGSSGASGPGAAGGVASEGVATPGPARGSGPAAAGLPPPPLALCGHALSLPGTLAHLGALEVAQALARGQCRPALDPELTDLDGLPVFTARVEPLACDPVADTPDESPALDPAPGGSEFSGPAHAPWPPHGRVARTQALLAGLSGSIWSQVDEALQPWRWLSPDADGGASEAVPAAADAPTWLAGVARPAARPQGPHGRLFVRVLVPESWPDAWQQAAVAAALSDAPEWLSGPAGVARITLDAAPWPVTDADGLWRHLSDWRTLHARRPRPESLWVVAADSLLDPDHIDQLQAQGELFTPHHQLGRVPGEGAAAVWLGTPEWQRALADLSADVGAEIDPGATSDGGSDRGGASDPAGGPAPRALHTVLQARRERSADLHGRVHIGTLLGLLAEAPSPAERLLTDADHRASRTAEVFEAVTEWAPALDPMQQVLRLGDACGDLGLARGLACLALAAGLPGPTTVALVHDPLRRTVMHLRSIPEPEVVK